MIFLSTKIKYLTIALFLCSLFSLWFVGRRISLFYFEDYNIVYYSREELETKNILSSVCENIPSTTPPNIHQESSTIYIVYTKFDLTNEESLNQFCNPYIYTKFYLRLGKNIKDQCAPESNIRGNDCEWYHMCVWNKSEDVFISKTIIEGHIWEEEMVRIAIEHLSKKATGIVIDAGANIGQYSLTAALLGHRVFAFEPIPDHVDMIQRSLALNGISERVHVFRNGLADYNDKTHINFHKDNKGGSTIDRLDNNVADKNDNRFITDGFELDLITLDNVLPIMNSLYPSLDIVYWKADIEGYEPRMFRGAWKLIANKKTSFRYI